MSDKNAEASAEQENAQQQAAASNAPVAEEEGQAGTAPDFEALAERLEEAESRAQENWDQFVRAKAELDNMRRRSERDLENAHKYALERFAQELLPVKDSLEMGLAAASEEDQPGIDKLREGTELTLKMLEGAMSKFGIEEINPEGEKFDPELHQAMSMLESNNAEPDTVVNVMQKGYTLNGRLIRPAMVVVAK